MKNFVAVSFCVLAALASSTNGDIRSLLGEEIYAKASVLPPPENSEEETDNPCCYVGDIEMFLQILKNGTERLQSVATGLISHVTRGCKPELNISHDIQMTYEELTKGFNLEYPKYQEDEYGILVKVSNNTFSCNVADYEWLLPKLTNGTADEKAAIFEVLMIGIQRCNFKYTFGNKVYRQCDGDQQQKWRQFWDWLVTRYKDRLAFNRKRISTQQLVL